MVHINFGYHGVSTFFRFFIFDNSLFVKVLKLAKLLRRIFLFFYRWSFSYQVKCSLFCKVAYGFGNNWGHLLVVFYGWRTDIIRLRMLPWYIRAWFWKGLLAYCHLFLFVFKIRVFFWFWWILTFWLFFFNFFICFFVRFFILFFILFLILFFLFFLIVFIVW